MRLATVCVSFIVLLAAFASAHRADAETVNCTAITALPAIISTSGVWCLTGDLDTSMTSGTAITIVANNVVLDLNGHKLGGLAAGAGTTAFGIRATNRQNLTIKNGTIRGFLNGINLDGISSSGHIVEDMLVDKNRAIGIIASGSGHIVRNNQVVGTGGTTAFGANANAYGIYMFGGEGARVLDNEVIGVTPTGTGTSWGVLISTANAFIVNNRVTDADRAIEFAGGNGKYRDNLVFDVGLGYVGASGIDAGNNF